MAHETCTHAELVAACDALQTVTDDTETIRLLQTIAAMAAELARQQRAEAA